MFGSTKQLIIAVTVVVLAGILVALGAQYVVHHRPHQQPPAHTAQSAAMPIYRSFPVDQGGHIFAEPHEFEVKRISTPSRRPYNSGELRDRGLGRRAPRRTHPVALYRRMMRSTWRQRWPVRLA